MVVGREVPLPFKYSLTFSIVLKPGFFSITLLNLFFKFSGHASGSSSTNIQCSDLSRPAPCTAQCSRAGDILYLYLATVLGESGTLSHTFRGKQGFFFLFQVKIYHFSNNYAK
uniref:Uncharacterized protein n=1 Tax=Cacopsylla melanoneura TaxID=428564 RepID=A0A8D8VCY2_9HEMI